MSLETFLNELDEEDVEEDEVLTASGVLNILTEAWINEKLSPELLPHKSEYVEVMMEQITQMEENVSRLNPTDLRNLIHRQELERIRFLIRSYLRIRLAKIEKYSLSLFKSTGIMSNQESNYLREYLTLSVEPLKSLCDRMSGPIGNLNPKQIEVSPDLETHVFVKSKCDLPEALIINDDELVVYDASWLERLCCMTFVSVLSHHIRDATRRGLWFYPFGSTRPLPKALYLSLLAALPHVVNLARTFDGLHSHHFDKDELSYTNV